MKAQSVVFVDMMSSFIDHLDDIDILVVLIQKMAKHHYNRGLRAKDMRVSIIFLLSCFGEITHARCLLINGNRFCSKCKFYVIYQCFKAVN